jgi:hypothetical protein
MMKKETLDTAIQLGQIIALLTPLANGSKDFNSRLSRLRARVEGQVVLAVGCAKTEAGPRAELRIAEMHQTLHSAVSRHVDLPVLCEQAAKAREVYSGKVIKGTGRRNFASALLDEVEAIKPEPNLGKGSDQSQRAEVAHAYASAVRNSVWLPTLLRLELPLARATSENGRLMAEYSTNQGRDALPKTLRSLCPSYKAADTALSIGRAQAPALAAGATPAPKRPRAKKVSVKGDGLFDVQVTVKADKLLAHPDIAALVRVTFKDAEPEPTLAQLLEKATTPVNVSPDESPVNVAQRLVDDLVKGLVARQKAADAERASIRAQAEALAAESAVAALRDMNPSLVAALKKNPELLQRV